MEHARTLVDDFYVPNVSCLTLMPLELHMYYETKRLKMTPAFMQGIINHSPIIRRRLKSAIESKQTKLHLRFTKDDIDHPSWLSFLSGTKRMKKKNFKKIDLFKFIAFSHSYMFHEGYINEIIDFDRMTNNRSVNRAIYYCLTVLKWDVTARNFLEITHGFRHLSIPRDALTRLGEFTKFVRSALRSRDRYYEATKFHNPYTGMPKVCKPEKNCVMCSPFGIEERIAREIEFSQNFNATRGPHRCPSFSCTSSYARSSNFP